ncbi:MAG: hypothetical protein EXR77_01110 [Myxococcales bacterium]|nr:hypothetical protein [Myxococcales bacterium]
MTGLHRRALDAAQPAVGRDVEAWCSKCAQAMEHVIVAMVGTQIVQVRCKTCVGTHKYKTTTEVAAAAPKAATKAAAKSATKGTTKAAGATPARTSKPPVESPELRAAKSLWQRKMAVLDRAHATSYAASLQPHAGQLVDHATFGYGIVESTTGGKAKCLFEQGYKVLIVCR